MPLVQITMLTGRTADQKRKLAQRITDAMIERRAPGGKPL
jgi:4-oxalocrotonate tautomerase family enzyme